MRKPRPDNRPCFEAVDVYLGLGSNMGNRQKNLEKALDLMRQRVNVILVSPTYDTEPVGNPDQPRFLNLTCQISTRLSPLELLTLTKGIESKLGRLPGPADSPRPIDIDILFYGNEVIETARLTIPHPRLQERGFVLVPLADIAPDLVHPVSGKSVQELMAALKKGVQGVFPWPGR